MSVEREGDEEDRPVTTVTSTFDQAALLSVPLLMLLRRACGGERRYGTANSGQLRQAGGYARP